MREINAADNRKGTRIFTHLCQERGKGQVDVGPVGLRRCRHLRHTDRAHELERHDMMDAAGTAVGICRPQARQQLGTVHGRDRQSREVRAMACVVRRVNARSCTIHIPHARIRADERALPVRTSAAGQIGSIGKR
jgi:hypothetical protein